MRRGALIPVGEVDCEAVHGADDRTPGPPAQPVCGLAGCLSTLDRAFAADPQLLTGPSRLSPVATLCWGVDGIAARQSDPGYRSHPRDLHRWLGRRGRVP